MSDFKDDNLKSFLKRNQPTPPSAKAEELSLILKKLEPTPKFQFKWFAIPTAALAGLLAFWFSMQTPEVDAPSAPRTIIQQQANNEQQVAMLGDDDFDLFEEEAPTLEVGEEYLTLAGL